MSPLNFGQSAGAHGKCKRHGANLLPRKRTDVAEQIATERAAEEARERLIADGEQVPTDTAQLRRERRKTAYCPRCVAEDAAAAFAYLNGETA